MVEFDPELAQPFLRSRHAAQLARRQGNGRQRRQRLRPQIGARYAARTPRKSRLYTRPRAALPRRYDPADARRELYMDGLAEARLSHRFRALCEEDSAPDRAARAL